MANPLVPVLDASVISMSSLEIAELTKVRHDNVKRTIETLAERGTIKLPQIEEVSTGQRGPKAAVYVFGHTSKRDSFVVVAQLSPEFTGALVDRWQELEEAARLPAPAPSMALPAASPHPEELSAALRPFLAARTQTTMPEMLAALFPGGDPPNPAGALGKAVGRALGIHFPEWQRRRAQTPDGGRPWIYQRRAGMAALPGPAASGIDDRIFTDIDHYTEAVKLALQFIRDCENAAKRGGAVPDLDELGGRIADGLCAYALAHRKYLVSFHGEMKFEPLPTNGHGLARMLRKHLGESVLDGVVREGVALLDRERAADLLGVLAERLRR